MLETAKCYDSAEGKHYVMGYLKLSWNASLRHTERYVAIDLNYQKTASSHWVQLFETYQTKQSRSLMHDARKRVLMRTTDNIICLSNLWFKRDELQYTLQEKNCCKTNVETVQHSCVKFRFLIILVQGNTKEVTSSKTYECSLQSKERVGIWVKICKLSTLDYEKKTCKSKKQHKMQKNNESLWYSERGTQTQDIFGWSPN